MVLADAAGERVEALAGELGGARGALALDVRDEDAVAAAMGELDVLVNVPGGLDDERARHAARGVGERLRRQRARDVPVLQARDPRHGAARGGAIVNIASVAGLVGLPQPRRLLRVEGRGHRPHPRDGHRPRRPGRPRQRRVPGTVDSPWVRRLVEEVGESLDALRARQPMGRLGTTEEVAAGGPLPRLRRRRLRHRDRARHRRRADGRVRRGKSTRSRPAGSASSAARWSRWRADSGGVDTLRDREWSDWLPILAWAIEHPDGPIVVDTGRPRAERAGLPAPLASVHRFGVRFGVAPANKLGPQLERVGIDPAGVRTVVLTHLHLDHAEACIMCRTPASSSQRASSTPPPGARAARRLPGRSLATGAAHGDDRAHARPYRRVRRGGAARRRRPGGSTPGHTPGHVSVVVEGDPAMVIAGDATYRLDLLMDGRIDGVAPDDAQARESVPRRRSSRPPARCACPRTTRAGASARRATGGAEPRRAAHGRRGRVPRGAGVALTTIA